MDAYELSVSHKNYQPLPITEFEEDSRPDHPERNMDSSKTFDDKNERIVFSVDRPAYNHRAFDEAFSYSLPPHLDTLGLVKSKVTHCKCSVNCFLNTFVSLIPILGWIRQYKIKSELLPDIFSGCTVAIMHIPQGMAYAMLANVPPIVGIYMAFFPVLIYLILGTSRHVSLGTFAVVCIMTGKLVDTHSSSGDVSLLTHNGTITEELTPIQVVSAVSLCVGFIQVIMFLFRLGIVSVILSDLLVSGLTTGAAVYVITSQIKHLLGITVGKHKGWGILFYIYIDIFSNIGKSNVATIVVSVITVLILILNNVVLKPLVAKKCQKFPLPIELLVVIVGSVISKYAKLETTYNIKTVGDIPIGLPAPKMPPVYLLKDIILDCIMIAFVAYAITLSMAKIFVKKLKYKIDANQEWFAQGMANIFGSMFSCAPVAASLSRSLIQEKVGGRTQLASLVSCILLLVVLLLIGPFFETLPTCVLAAIITVALKGMLMQVMDLKRVWGRSRMDATLWLAPFLASIFLDIGMGLLISIIYSLVVLVARSQRPYLCKLGKLEGKEVYKDSALFRQAQDVSGVKVVQFNGILHFANLEHFRESLCSLVQMVPNQIIEARKRKTLEANKDLVTSRDVLMNIAVTPTMPHKDKLSVSLNNLSQAPVDVHYIILDLSNMGGIDSAGVDVLLSLVKEFEEIDIFIFIVVPSGPADAMLSACDFYKKLNPQQVYSTLNDALHWAAVRPDEQEEKMKIVYSP